MLEGGTIVDATIINVPSSTKNVAKQCDSEMHQTKKGNHEVFGDEMSQIGVDAFVRTTRRRVCLQRFGRQRTLQVGRDS